jgi:Ca2+/H+ antiporter
VVALISWAIDPLALSVRPLELLALGASTVLAALVLAPGRTTRSGGSVLLALYAALVIAFYFAGDR